MTVWEIKTLVWYWSWLDWWQIYYKGAWFFKMQYIKLLSGQTNKYWFTYSVPIGSSKQTIEVQFESYTPIVAYHQHDQNIFSLKILASVLKKSNELVARNAIAIRKYV